MKEKLPFSKQIAYAMGQFGWSLLSGIIGTFLVYYYIPTEKSGIPVLIPQIVIFGFLSIIGLITMGGRLFDAITDPLIASFSDRSKSKRGRRISFMRASAIPFAATTVLVFVNPIQGDSWINALFLTVMLLLYFLFFTMYVTPYYALISEIGHTPEERLNLSTYISVTWFLGFAVASQSPVLWDVFVNMGYEKLAAIRITFVILALIALILLYIPIFFIDEKRYSDAQPSELKMMDSIKATFNNKDFRVFAFSDLVYWIAITMFQNALLYYITVLLDQPESMLGILLIFLGIGSFIFYAPVNFLAKKLGKKKLMVTAFLLFIGTYIFGGLLGKMPIDNSIQAYMLVIFASVPMAIFGIIPNVIIADVAQYDANKTGVRREAMFYGVRTFMSKIGQTLSMLVLSALLLFKVNGSNVIGIRLTSIFAAGFCLIGLLLFLSYDEEKILKGLKKAEDEERNLSDLKKVE